MAAYDAKIEQRLGVMDKDIDLTEVPHWNRLLYDEDDPRFMEEFEKVINDDWVPHADDRNGSLSIEDGDAYINMEIGLPCGGDNRLYTPR